jgi:hypothetical protein
MSQGQGFLKKGKAPTQRFRSSRRGIHSSTQVGHICIVPTLAKGGAAQLAEHVLNLFEELKQGPPVDFGVSSVGRPAGSG